MRTRRRGDNWLHPNHTSDCSATVSHDDRLYVYSTSTPFEPTGAGDPHGYSKFDAYAVLNHGGDEEAAKRALRRKDVDANMFQRGEGESFDSIHLCEPCKSVIRERRAAAVHTSEPESDSA